MNEDWKSKPHVLLVEDDPDFRKLVKDWLDPWYDVAEADGADSFFAEVGQQAPDAVVMDMRLPGTDGAGLCRTFKEDPRNKDVPILFLSGSHESGDFVRAVGAGAAAFLAKPVERKQLLARLRLLMGR